MNMVATLMGPVRIPELPVMQPNFLVCNLSLQDVCKYKQAKLGRHKFVFV